MKDTVYMEEMDAFTYRDKLSRGAIVFVPVGALEQHGEHMAMCVDAVLTRAMAGAVAQGLPLASKHTLEGVVAAPINYGYRSQQRSGGGFHLAGTTSLSGDTLIALTKDIISSLIGHGARKLVMMNGHYENYQFIFEGCELALEKAKSEGINDVKIQLLSYWDFVDDTTIEQLYPEGFTGWDLEHAGVMETSLMLLLFPDLVDMSKVKAPLYDSLPAQLPNYDVLPIISHLTPPSGCLSSPDASTSEKGQILQEVAVSNMLDAITQEF